MDRIVQVFSNVHMGYGHPGLSAILKKNIGRMFPKDGELFVFINKKKSAAKVYAAKNIVFHLKPESGRIEMHSILELPHAIGVDGTLNYSKALELALKRKR